MQHIVDDTALLKQLTVAKPDEIVSWSERAASEALPRPLQTAVDALRTEATSLASIVRSVQRLVNLKHRKTSQDGELKVLMSQMARQTFILQSTLVRARQGFNDWRSEHRLSQIQSWQQSHSPPYDPFERPDPPADVWEPELHSIGRRAASLHAVDWRDFVGRIN